MKTGNDMKKALLVGAAFVAVGAMVPSYVYAAEDSASAVESAAVEKEAAAAVAAAEAKTETKTEEFADIVEIKTTPSPSASMVPSTTAAAPATATVSPLSSTTGTGSSPANEPLEKTITKIGDKAVDAAKKQIKDLESMDDTTLQDLTEARQTITRIDAVIDMEKKINELQRIRADRRNIGGSGAAARIAPPSLDSLLPNVAPIAAPIAPVAPINLPSISVPSGRPEVAQILGTEGRYVAVLKIGKDRHSVRIGDKIPSGDTVEGITSTSITLLPAGKGKRTPYTINVKNVDIVQGSVR